MQKNQPLKCRIASLDGLRGIAILSVVFLHYYSPSPPGNNFANLSYGHHFQNFFLFEYGYFGVMLFFSISGFVISQTLHNSNSALHFGVRRFSRLWPTMLLCSTLTFAVSFIDPITIEQSINNFLPSLTFLDPRLFDVILKPSKFEYIDAVYWTLFTEIRFYLLVALLYFSNKERFFIHVLIFSSAVGLIFSATIYLEVAPLRSALNFLLIAWYLPWFTFGIGCFYLSSNELKKAIWLMTTSFAFLMFYVLAATYKPFMPFSGVAHIMGALLIFTLMIAAIKIVIFKDILSCKFLSSIGLTSYSLYLLHRIIGQKIISTIGNPFNLTPAQSGIYPLFTLTFLIGISHLIYRYWENPSNRIINEYFKRHSKGFKKHLPESA